MVSAPSEGVRYSSFEEVELLYAWLRLTEPLQLVQVPVNEKSPTMAVLVAPMVMRVAKVPALSRVWKTTLETVDAPWLRNWLETIDPTPRPSPKKMLLKLFAL